MGEDAEPILGDLKYVPTNSHSKYYLGQNMPELFQKPLKVLGKHFFY